MTEKQIGASVNKIGPQVGHFVRECPETPPAGFKGGKGKGLSQAEGKGKGKGSQSYSFSGPFLPIPSPN